MESSSPDMYRSLTEPRRRGMWRAFLVVLVMIVPSSIAGRQIFELFPPPVIWALIAGSGLAVFVAAAVIYKGPLPRRALTIGITLGATAFVLAVLAGAMTPAEIAHVVFFGTLGAILSPLVPRLALPLLAAVSAGDELLQALLPWRVSSLFDVVFNVVSASGGYELVRYHEPKRAGRADAP